MEATLNRPAPADLRAGKARLWTARILGSLLVLFLVVDAIGKILRLAPHVEGTTQLGYSDGVVAPLGFVLLTSTLLYVVPRTSVLGAILLTGYLGGAVATHVRMGQPGVVPIVFPIVFGAIAWGCLYLRDERVRALFAFEPRGASLSSRTPSSRPPIDSADDVGEGTHD